MKNKLKTILCSVIIGSTLISTTTTAFATETNDNTNTVSAVENFNVKGIGSPAQDEYTTKNGTLTKSNLDSLKAAADKAEKQNTNVARLSYALNLSANFFPSASTGLKVAGTVAKLGRSELKPYATVSYCYDRLSYMYSHPGAKAYGQVKYKRHFNGFIYDVNWYPIGAPVHLGYK